MTSLEKNIRTFASSLFITLLAIVGAFLYGGAEAVRIIIILGILEITLSFDNAVVNARVLTKLSKYWQKIFLTVGILIAVLGVRLILPLIIVSLTTGMSPLAALRLALEKLPANDPNSYAAKLIESHTQIAAFGGLFLLLVFLEFFIDSNFNFWLTWVEKPLAKLKNMPGISVIIVLVLLLFLYTRDEGKGEKILVAGIAGILTYLLVSGLGKISETGLEITDPTPQRETIPAVGKTAFFLFLYLEILDASFSFDGVIGAFAITSDPILITLGLGLIGAIFVRSITMYLVNNGTLENFPYLVNGAHWAIGALGALMIISIFHPISEILTGSIGIILIILSIISSLIQENRVHT